MKFNMLSSINTVAYKTFIVVCLLYLVASTQAQKTSKELVGLQLWSVRDDMKKDPVATIESIGKMGYGFIEAAGYADGKFYGMAPDSFRLLCEKNGLQFLSSHVGYALPDSANWDSTMLWWEHCIQAHKNAGVKFIVQPSMNKAAYEDLKVLKRYCNYFNAIGEKCNANGIRFGYHNHTKEFNKIDDTILYDYMLQHTDSSKVTFECDIYWAYEAGVNSVDYFKKYPGRFELLHIKDAKELGSSGTIDFKSIFDNSSIAGTKYFVIEVEEYSFQPIESVQKSIEYLSTSGLIE